MIDKEYNKYFGVCNACGEITDEFDTWEDCEDWLEGNWQTNFNQSTQEFEHYCEDCMD